MPPPLPLARLFVALPLGAALTLAPRPAHAGDPVAIDVEVAAVGGYDTAPTHARQVNPLGLGIGGRAGVVANGLYAGVSVVDYLGDTFSSDGTTLEARSLLAGAELGYTLDVLGLKVRPQLGMGAMAVTSSAQFPGMGAIELLGFEGNGTTTYLYVQPSVLAEVKLGWFLVGADVGAFCIPMGPPGDDAPASSSAFDVAFAAHAQVGVAL